MKTAVHFYNRQMLLKITYEPKFSHKILEDVTITSQSSFFLSGCAFPTLSVL